MIDEKLTKTERRIAQAIFQDKDNKDMAKEFFVTVSAIKFHISNIFKKYPATSKSDFRRKYREHFSQLIEKIESAKIVSKDLPAGKINHHAVSK